ncbi:uncharacterized protein [Epargyreus clarus]|uniref:uncharacterized protein n=1 Tax=Epargyreus clarus TaxID=520877 RepID=UPI003C300979
MSSMDSIPAPVIKTLFKRELDSSEEPPMDEWSSLDFELPDRNIKRIKYDHGLYHPGSGEICAKYIPLSASSVLRHPYYNYPGIKDPGVEDALLLPEPKIKYPDDGQELYLSLCKTGNLCPIRIFHKELLEEKINLSYYGIHPMAFRAIALSLRYNRIVTVLDLTDNWISLDGCFHLGEMLIENISIRELNLYGCRIGVEGARRLFASLHLNRSLKKLDLTKNQLLDTGVEMLAKAIFLGSDVAHINLSRNELTAKAVLALCEAFETNNKLTHLDLSWNSILSPNAVYTLCQRLYENNMIEELNLSWNSLSGLRVGNGIKVLLQNTNIQYINLSNNKLSTPVVKPITANLNKAISLVTLNLSYNPFTPQDALSFLLTLRERKVKLQNLLLDNVIVTDEFIDQRNFILSMGHRKKTVVTCGYVQKRFISQGVDMRELVLDRIDSLCTKSKKQIDFALVVEEMFRANKEHWDTKVFTREIKNRGAQLDEDLLQELFRLFAGASSEKSKTVNLAALIEYFKRKWPDRKLPPTPPPEPAVKSP